MPKEFTVKKDDGTEVKLSIKMPNFNELTEADFTYSAKIAELVKSQSTKKLLLRQELETFLKNEGIWTEVQVKKVEKLQKEVQTLNKKLDRGGIKLSEGRKIAIDMMNKRAEIFETIKCRQVFDHATIESVAESHRNDFIVYLSVVYAENGQRYWPDFDSMLNDKNSAAFRDGYTNTLSIVFGVDADLERRLPETKFLLKHRFIDENLRYITKEGSYCTEDGKPIEKDNPNLTEELPFLDEETNEPIVNTKEEKVAV